jgi:hypothetical protein
MPNTEVTRPGRAGGSPMRHAGLFRADPARYRALDVAKHTGVAT